MTVTEDKIRALRGEAAYAENCKKHAYLSPKELSDLLDEIEGKQRIIDAQAGMIADLQESLREEKEEVLRALGNALGS